ncbi:MAG: hypothetical protein D5R97_02975 [Candidatus Syntrophonatronum acetioxidans]|uniref:Uncharacterized protein n=1 Tax=Candidatus Syntrophonatronum acetioxidans TaxID=1795816 RepID=A0A424YGK5_9FIRM|nr:MAG: hypothetical protein D5R97_02975 [Candidatus Syntrophonatronum acetioxidans]
MGGLDRFSVEVLRTIAIFFVIVGVPNFVLLSVMELEINDMTIGVMNFFLVLLIGIFVTSSNRGKGID